MSKIYPTFSAKGNIRSPAEKLDYALSHFFIAERSQSYLNKVVDIRAILNDNKDNPLALCSDMENQLSEHLLKIFDHSTVRVEIDKIDEKGNIDLKISVGIYDEDRPIDTQRLVHFKMGVFKHIAKLNNEG